MREWILAGSMIMANWIDMQYYESVADTLRLGGGTTTFKGRRRHERAHERLRGMGRATTPWTMGFRRGTGVKQKDFLWVQNVRAHFHFGFPVPAFCLRDRETRVPGGFASPTAWAGFSFAPQDSIRCFGHFP